MDLVKVVSSHDKLGIVASMALRYDTYVCNMVWVAIAVEILDNADSKLLKSVLMTELTSVMMVLEMVAALMIDATALEKKEWETSIYAMVESADIKLGWLDSNEDKKVSSVTIDGELSAKVM